MRGAQLSLKPNPKPNPNPKPKPNPNPNQVRSQALLEEAGAAAAKHATLDAALKGTKGAQAESQARCAARPTWKASRTESPCTS